MPPSACTSIYNGSPCDLGAKHQEGARLRRANRLADRGCERCDPERLGALMALSTSGCSGAGPGEGKTSDQGPIAPRVTTVPSHDHMLYHMVMGRREVLVQLDDNLVDRLDRLAEQQGTSRSDLLRRGAAAVLEAAERAEADQALQDAYRRLPQDPAIVSAASRLASLTAPEW